MASETLEASQHRQGPLLESFLTPRTSNLTFQEVVDCVLHENQHASECSLNYLLAHHAHTREELDDLTKAQGESDKCDKSSQKRIKKEIDLRCKELESLRECISYYESHLGQDPSEDNTPMMTACLVTVHRLGWLLPQESTTFLQRAPQLKSLISLQLKTKPMPWRWMMRVFTHIQLAHLHCRRRFADGRWCDWGGVGLGPPYGLVSKEPKWQG